MAHGHLLDAAFVFGLALVTLQINGFTARETVDLNNEYDFLPTSDATGTSRPIIGVVAQTTYGKRAKHGPSYFAASYVKFIESAGGRVVPIKINQTEEYYQYMFKRINGVLLPGGGQDLLHSGYSNAARFFFNASKNSGDYFPIWGTCLGFEQLLVLAAEKNILDHCYGTSDVALSIMFYDGVERSRLFGNAPKDVMRALEMEDITANYHKKCLWLKTFFNNSAVKDFYNILATNVDSKWNGFISAIEAKQYPFYGLQFHPEKNPFEWNPSKKGIVHSESAVKVAQYFANFFVAESRKNGHKFASRDEEEENLIYNFSPVYTGKLDDSSFEQAYFFDV